VASAKYAPACGIRLENPRYTTHAILRELIQTDEKFLGQVTGVLPRQIAVI